ncbi:ABC transporter permease subunit [Paenibacillus filicis]|uniref:ABC transporter permease subunit n=1 Tax=Paenibacillus gyeongsangnamensis TaxID=3388067 RepID=A0ABT4Q457_9BACL|nr:ABC transporter permease subunit [Paenibacillus filicis]MCZ8511596.1 ABC transporter permease subunit [Paenibacillus filicis]
MNAAKKLTLDTNGDGKTDQWGFWLFGRYAQIEPWLYQNDGDILNPDKTQFAVNENGKETLKFLIDLTVKYKVSPTPKEMKGIKQEDVFPLGKAAMWVDGSFAIDNIRKVGHIPGDLKEAAKMDGAGPVMSFFFVTIPMLTPTIFFVVIITIIESFHTFDITYAMTKGGPYQATTTLSYFIYQNAFVHFRIFLRYLGNSALISTTASLGQLLTCSLAAFAFARMSFPGKSWIFSLLVATLMIPMEVTIIPEFLLFSKLGWLNTYAPLIVPSLLAGAFGTFMLREFFLSVPASLEEAAIIDGCSPYRVYGSVFLPLAKPSLATLFIIAFMNNWNEVLRPVLYIQSPGLRTLTLGLSQFQSEYSTNWNLLLAGSVITILPLIVVYLFNQRYIIEGTMTSGVKG